MNDKNNLIELLKDIIEIARSQNNELTINEIKAYLKDLSLEEVQFEPIYEYLTANHIIIKDYVKDIKNGFEFVDKEEDRIDNTDSNTDKKEQSYQNTGLENNPDDKNSEIVLKEKQKKQEKEDLEFLSVYLEELNYINTSSEEITKLITKFIQGDVLAKDKLLEANLKIVVDIAKTFKGNGISISDLIQEGNLGLIHALDSYKEACNNSGNDIDFDSFIKSEIRNILNCFVQEEIENDKLDKRIIEKVSALTERLKELTEDLGKKPTVKEAATYLNMSIDEIKDIIQLSNEEDIPIAKEHSHRHIKQHIK